MQILVFIIIVLLSRLYLYKWHYQKEKKIDKWTIEERIMSKDDIMVEIRRKNEIVDFRWKRY